jgi:hypothetical protein
MKSLSFIAAAAVATPLSFAMTQAVVAAPTADMCRPLSASNLEECCAAQDWQNIIQQGDVRFCPPLNNDQTSGRLGEALPPGGGNPGGGNPPAGQEPPTTGSISGNPGNAAPVGMAGEKPDKGMAENNGIDGVEGKSN